jgi:hypothetical protein
MRGEIKMNTLQFTFEHKHTKTIRKAFGCNVWEAYKNAEILTAEAREVWVPITVETYYLA